MKRHIFRPQKQTSFLPPSRKEHGGALALNKRRSRRPLSTKAPIHVMLRSDFAKGPRSLLKHQFMIRAILRKASRLFQIKVYRVAICGNHLHFLVRGHHREDLQNFFRVLSGHVAQNILREFPVAEAERGGAPQKRKHPKNQRKFWALLIYSRVLSGWGREFRVVAKYIEQNVLEALNLLPYQPRKSRFSSS
jgi:REP element-mobilizing transposase RayT